MLKVRPYKVTGPRGVEALQKEEESDLKQFYLKDASSFQENMMCRTYDLLDGDEWYGYFSMANSLLELNPERTLEKFLDKKMIKARNKTGSFWKTSSEIPERMPEGTIGRLSHCLSYR